MKLPFFCFVRPDERERGGPFPMIAGRAAASQTRGGDRNNQFTKKETHRAMQKFRDTAAHPTLRVTDTPTQKERGKFFSEKEIEKNP